MSKLMTRALRLKNKLMDKMSAKEKGVDQIVLILIIIAVAAGIIGAFYIWGKGVLLPAVEESINNSIQTWFNPN